MDGFLAVYLICGLLILGFELWAVRNKQKGDTITEKVRSMRWTHAIMVGLLAWALFHFTIQDVMPRPFDADYTSWFVAFSGILLGLYAHDHWRRS